MRNKLKIKNKYGTIPNKILNDPTLSLKAKGLFGYLQSKPDGWRFSVKRIAIQQKDGKGAVQNAIVELETKGYLKREAIKDEKGKWAGYDYILSENPLTENPLTENPSADNPLTENPVTLSKKDISNKDIVKKSIDNSNASVAESKLSKKNSNKNNPVSLIVDFFYKMSNWPLPSTPAEQKLYRRWLRPAKDLLELCDGSVEEANSCIKKVGDWAISHQLSWGIETVFKKWYDLDLLKPKEKKPYYDGKRIFQKTEGGRYYVVSRDGEIKELGITPKKEDIVWK